MLKRRIKGRGGQEALRKRGAGGPVDQRRGGSLAAALPGASAQRGGQAQQGAGSPGRTVSHALECSMDPYTQCVFLHSFNNITTTCKEAIRSIVMDGIFL